MSLASPKEKLFLYLVEGIATTKYVHNPSNFDLMWKIRTHPYPYEFTSLTYFTPMSVFPDMCLCTTCMPMCSERLEVGVRPSTISGVTQMVMNCHVDPEN